MGRLAIALLCALACHGLLLLLPVSVPGIAPELSGKTSITIHLAAAVPVKTTPVPVPSRQQTIQPAVAPLPVIRQEHRKKRVAKHRTEQPSSQGSIQKSPPAPASPSLQKPADSSRGSRASALIKATPLYQSNPKPVYPSLARRRGQQGAVMLQVMVSETGGAEQVTLYRSSGFRLLDSAALTAVRSWRFVPGTENGRPAKSQVLIPVHFILQ